MGLGAAGSIALGSAVLGAGTSLYGSMQTGDASQDASGLQLQMYNRTRGDLGAYFTPGAEAMTNALALANRGPTGGGPDYVAQAAGMVPGRMTQAELEQTPGYQFDLRQGLKAVQSSAAARGLGVSGAALKGAGSYATGLANKTYLDQFNVAQKRFEDTMNLNTGQQGQITNQFSRLKDVATLGEAAAAGTGTAGTSAAATAGNYLNASGLDQAAGTTGVQNALTGGANSYLGQQNFNTLMNRYGGGSQTSGYSTAQAGDMSNIGNYQPGPI